jgi:hypothetical protein
MKQEGAGKQGIRYASRRRKTEMSMAQVEAGKPGGKMGKKQWERGMKMEGRPDEEEIPGKMLKWGTLLKD